MTSRRTFLGLMAAAPVAVPAAVKAATQSGYVYRGRSFDGEPWSLSSISFDECSFGESVLSEAQSRAFSDAVIRAPQLRVESMARPVASLETPNRLYGVEINDEGDAI